MAKYQPLVAIVAVAVREPPKRHGLALLLHVIIRVALRIIFGR